MICAGYQIKRVVAIQNYLISGSFFLQSLLDGHPQVLSLPNLYCAEFYFFWPQLADLDDASRVKVFIEAHSNWFSEQHVTVCGLGLDRNEMAIVDPERFSDELIKILNSGPPLDRDAFYCAIHIAYALALGRKLPRKDLVLIAPIHSTNSEMAHWFMEGFPDALYLFTIRHPATNFAAGVRHMVNYLFHERFNVIHSAFTQLFLNRAPQIGGHEVFGDRPYREEMRHQCRAVRLEDLHTYPEQVMRAVAEWIGIGWRDELLKSTLDGKIWWNTRPRRSKVPDANRGSPSISGFDPHLPWRELNTKLTRIDRFRLNVIADRKNRAFGYEKREFSPLVRLLRFLVVMVLILLPFQLEREVPLSEKRLENFLLNKYGFFGALSKMIFLMKEYWRVRFCLWKSAVVIKFEPSLEVTPLEFDIADKQLDN